MEKRGLKYLFGKGLFIYPILLPLLLFTVFILVVVASEGGQVGFVNLLMPLNNTISLDGDITFSYNITNSTPQSDNCSLIFDGVVNQTDTNVTYLETQYFYLSDLDNGDYTWGVNCTDSGGNETSSETRDLEVFIDITDPVVTLNSPSDSSEVTNGSVNFGYSVTDSGWINDCSLYTDIGGAWGINQTNIFVQENYSVYFEVTNLPDDTTFNWNVLCHDFATTPNFAWGGSNWTLTINNTPPSYSTIPDQEWNEDSIHMVKLGNYFSDIDGDALTYSSTSLTNISIRSEERRVGKECRSRWSPY